MKQLNYFLSIITLFGIFANSYSQEKVSAPMAASGWDVRSEEYKFETYLGDQSIYLPAGLAHLNDVIFHNGVIEFDIAFLAGRGFPGVYFRMLDEENTEDFYIRPHQSSNPDANQYTPVFNGLAGWQLYYGDGHGAPVEYRYDAWNHVKLVIKGTIGEVFINDMTKPLFQINELKHGDIKGSIALKGSAQAHFANFSYSLDENPQLMLPIKELPSPDERVIRKYQVSSAVKDADVIAKPRIDLKNFDGLTWTSLPAEFSGTINIAKAVHQEEGKNTSLIRFTINSDSEQVKRLEFGYSDIAQVFVNGKAVYLGNNTYRSRDYRYLGTIGYFDAVFLELKKGDNEIVISVTEGFGGWGMKAQLDDMNGVTMK
jgi:hypothetical protein